MLQDMTFRTFKMGQLVFFMPLEIGKSGSIKFGDKVSQLVFKIDHNLFDVSRLDSFQSKIYTFCLYQLIIWWRISGLDSFQSSLLVITTWIHLSSWCLWCPSENLYGGAVNFLNLPMVMGFTQTIYTLINVSYNWILNLYFAMHYLNNSKID